MLNEELRVLRKRKNLTQQQVAERLGVDRTTYTSYETGKVYPSLRMLQRIAEVFEVPLSRLAPLDDFAPGAQFPDLYLSSSDGFFSVNMEEEFNLVMRFRMLTPDSKRRLFAFIQTLPTQLEEPAKTPSADDEEAEQNG